MELTINLTSQEVIDGLSLYNDRSQIMDLVLGIDLRVAEVEFTEELIKKLSESLLVDVPPEKQDLAKQKLSEFLELLN